MFIFIFYQDDSNWRQEYYLVSIRVDGRPFASSIWVLAPCSACPLCWGLNFWFFKAYFPPHYTKPVSLAVFSWFFSNFHFLLEKPYFSYSHQCDLIFVCSNSVLELLCWKAVLLQRLYSLGISSLEKLYLSLIQRADFLVLS